MFSKLIKPKTIPERAFGTLNVLVIEKLRHLIVIAAVVLAIYDCVYVSSNPIGLATSQLPLAPPDSAITAAEEHLQQTFNRSSLIGHEITFYFGV